MRRVTIRSADKIAFRYTNLEDSGTGSIYVTIDGEKHRMPTSQIVLNPDTKRVAIPEWLAMNHGLI